MPCRWRAPFQSALNLVIQVRHGGPRRPSSSPADGKCYVGVSVHSLSKKWDITPTPSWERPYRSRVRQGFSASTCCAAGRTPTLAGSAGIFGHAHPTTSQLVRTARYYAWAERFARGRGAGGTGRPVGSSLWLTGLSPCQSRIEGGRRAGRKSEFESMQWDSSEHQRQKRNQSRRLRRKNAVNRATEPR